MSTIVVWGNFLVHEKLDPVVLEDRDVELVIILITELAVRFPNPKPFKAYNARLICRDQVCNTAMDLGIDLTGMKNRKGKQAIGRGLLDSWVKEYGKRYGGTVGTVGDTEIKRREIVSRLAKQGIRRIK